MGVGVTRMFTFPASSEGLNGRWEPGEEISAGEFDIRSALALAESVEEKYVVFGPSGLLALWEQLFELLLPWK